MQYPPQVCFPILFPVHTKQFVNEVELKHCTIAIRRYPNIPIRNVFFLFISHNQLIFFFIYASNYEIKEKNSTTMQPFT